MIRKNIQPRSEWQGKVESVGLNYHTIDDAIYWDESACYVFSSGQIDRLEEVTGELYGMCLEAVRHVVRRNLFTRMGIGEEYIPLIKRSWELQEPSMYGRFDFIYNGTDEPRLLEFNADTPTALLEASVAQWFWMKDVFPDGDQFNSIHEKLTGFWTQQNFQDTLYFACVKDHDEDFGNVEYIRDVAVQAGYDTEHIFIEDIGWDSGGGRFVDLDGGTINVLFKLYPWEWLFEDEFGKNLLLCEWNLIEPAWKIILSNKSILPLLWDLYPDHPNLLPCYFVNRFADNYVRKPFFSREGSNITIVKHMNKTEEPGTYGAEGYVYQQYCPVPQFNGNYVTIGSWVINGQSAGIGIREDVSEITKNSSRFIPHIFEE